jgi:tetratricopeptide (TPR) repeat protein
MSTTAETPQTDRDAATTPPPVPVAPGVADSASPAAASSASAEQTSKPTKPTARPADPDDAPASPTTRLIAGFLVWASLVLTVAGSAYLIQWFFGADVLRKTQPAAVQLDVTDVLVADGGYPQLARAVATLRPILEADPADPDAVLLLVQVSRAAPPGTAVEREADSLLAVSAAALQKRIEGGIKSVDSAEAAMLLAHIRPKEAERLLAEAKGVLEARVAAAPSDGRAAFALARTLMSPKAPDAEAHRRSVQLARVAGRPEKELRLRRSSRIPLEIAVDRISKALDLGQDNDALRLLNDLSELHEDDPRYKFARAEAIIHFNGRPEDDRRGPRDEELIGLLTPAAESRDVPLRARMYLAALEATGKPEEKERAAKRRAETLAAGYKPMEEIDRMLGTDAEQAGSAQTAPKMGGAAGMAPARYGRAMLLMSAEILLGQPGSPERSAALLKRAELDMQTAAAESREGEPGAEPAIPTAAIARLRECVAAGPKKGSDGSAAVFARAAGFLAGLEPDEAKAKATFADALAAGLKPAAEIESLTKARLFAAARWLAVAAAERGFGITGDPAADSELWYLTGRSYVGLSLTHPKAEPSYRKAIEVGGSAKPPTAGAGRAAFNLARISANQPGRSAEAERFLSVAEAAGIKGSDILTLDGLRGRVREAKARDAAMGGHFPGDGHDHGPGPGDGKPAPKPGADGKIPTH